MVAPRQVKGQGGPEGEDVSDITLVLLTGTSAPSRQHYFHKRQPRLCSLLDESRVARSVSIASGRHCVCRIVPNVMLATSSATPREHAVVFHVFLFLLLIFALCVYVLCVCAHAPPSYPDLYLCQRTSVSTNNT